MAEEDEDFGAMLDASLVDGARRGARRLRPGESVQGVVVQIGKDAVFVDVGTLSEGQIERWELQDRDGNLTVGVGDRVRATVEIGGDRPKLVVAFGRGGMDGAALSLALEAGAPVEGTFGKAVKAGLEVDLGGARAFCPASQVDTAYVDDLSVWEGQRYLFKVIDVRDNGRSVVVSRKAILLDERQAAGRDALARLAVGAEVEGTVSAIQPYGAFVDLGGVEGLVHVSELGHGRVDRVEDVVSIGEKVSVRVLEIEGNRIKLSMRQGGGASTREASEPEQIVDGKVTNVEGYGVFVQTAAGGGLVPNKELELPPGADAKRVYSVGQEVRVVVLGREGGGRLRLSIRRVEDAEARAAYQEFRGEEKKRAKPRSVGSLGELLLSKLGGIASEVPSGPEATSESTSEPTASGDSAEEATADRPRARRRRV